MNEAVFDYIVVGAGSAGCALAHRITESGRNKVLVLESGGSDRHLWVKIPIGVAKTLMDDRLVWKFHTEPEKGLNGQSVFWPRGRMLGGSGSVNGMVYVRGDPYEFDNWAKMGNDGWTYRDILPVYRRLETFSDGENQYRGSFGGLNIINRATVDPDELSAGFVAACGETGMPVLDDYNAEDWDGAHFNQLNTRNGLRHSTADAFLRPALKRNNLTLETHAHVEKILFEGRRAVGVRYRQGDKTVAVRAAKEIILSAGSVQSPQILELSGVGGGALLKDLDIPVVHDLPGVGENLTDHLQVRMVFECTKPITINDLMRSPWRKLAAGLNLVFRRKGVMTSVGATASAICRTRPELARPDVKIQLYQLSGTTRFSRTAALGMDPYSGFAIGGYKLKPKSRGSVHIKSADPMDAPAIHANYLTAEEDRVTCVDMLRLIRNVGLQPSLKKLIVAERRPGPDIATDDGLLAYAKETGQSSFHPVSSCRMGTDDDAVVDPQLRVKGVEGLRVADASIMPTMVSSNTNAPSILIGERCADFINQA